MEPFVPETPLETAAVEFMEYLQTVDDEVIKVQRTERYKLNNDSCQEFLTAEQWDAVRKMIKRCTPEDVAYAIADLKGIPFSVAHAEFLEYMDACEPETDLEKAWADAMDLAFEIAEETRGYRKSRSAPPIDVDAVLEDTDLDNYEDEEVDAIYKAELERLKKMTPEEAFVADQEGRALIQEVSLMEIEAKVLVSEMTALNRMVSAKKRLDELLPPSFPRW